jgi:large subunit ribosomal protein L19
MTNITTWIGKIGETEKRVTFHVGDTIRVHYKLIEHEKVAGKTKREVHEETHERTQVFEGIVIAIKGEGINLMFTVRRIGIGSIGIERIFPIQSPWIKKIDVKKTGQVRRAKLYYLRGRTGKAATKIEESVVHPAQEKRK